MYAIDLDAQRPGLVAEFWAGLLGWHTGEQPDGSHAVTDARDDGPTYRLLVHRVDTAKTGQNRIHLDLTSRSAQDMQAIIDRALALGGRRIDIGQGDDDHHEVMADPEGNEFCVIEPTNRFLADTATIGAVNCDGTRAVGEFWSAALAWPLVWDQDEETAIQDPAGGSKITWSGPPLLARYGRERLRLVLAATDDADRAEVVTALQALGARVLSADPDSDVTMADPDGNEFRVVIA